MVRPLTVSCNNSFIRFFIIAKLGTKEKKERKKKDKSKVPQAEPYHLLILFGSPTRTEGLTTAVFRQTDLHMLKIGREC